jgi:hypothetical protein
MDNVNIEVVTLNLIEKGSSLWKFRGENTTGCGAEEKTQSHRQQSQRQRGDCGLSKKRLA